MAESTGPHTDCLIRLSSEIIGEVLQGGKGQLARSHTCRLARSNLLHSADQFLALWLSLGPHEQICSPEKPQGSNECAPGG